ncbi:hypothetical protein N9Y81_00425 [Akkermansiaceae bacterium]|jgi:truncated hemoglobin YjbI|nr:hypothetical protein [Akkermansiaceae bacterium]
MPSTLPDLPDRKGIESLVNCFYDTVRQDETLGFIFDEVAQVNWELHFQNVCLLGNRSFP